MMPGVKAVFDEADSYEPSSDGAEGDVMFGTNDSFFIEFTNGQTIQIWQSEWGGIKPFKKP